MVGSNAAFATISMNTTFGLCRNLAGAALVPDGTLWVMIVDTNGDNALPQLALNSGISTSLQSPFWYANLSLGSVVANDTVFAMGSFNGTANGFTGADVASVSDLALGTLGLTAGRNFGFYWFPGVTYTGPANQVVGWGGGSVGAINSTTGDANLGYDPMTIPAEGGSTAPGSGSIELGGEQANTKFNAVAIVPETSTALLGALGALGLLRRRR